MAEERCPFCKSKRKDEISYECGTLDNSPYPRTYYCALNAYMIIKEELSEIYERELDGKITDTY
jgi:hypothetical protein